MKVKVYDKNLEPVGDVELNSEIFETKPQIELIEEAVRVQRANSRAPIANTKTRGEVSGGGKKPWKQKGTGNARAGSIRSPIWRHGGITFGPRSNRNFSLKMNKKQWRQALYMALADKALSNGLIVVSELFLDRPKTKDMLKLLDNFRKKIAGDSRKFLFILPKKDKNLERSSKNLEQVNIAYANNLNIIDILKHDSVVVSKPALEIIEKTYLE